MPLPAASLVLLPDARPRAVSRAGAAGALAGRDGAAGGAATTVWSTTSCPAARRAEPVRTRRGVPIGGGASLGLGAWWPRILPRARVADAGT
jgi:hypothetical protein